MENKPLLLVAEDDPDDQFFFQEAIAIVCPTQVETHIVWDGAQLINYLRENAQGLPRRNLVILDLNMRVKDGRATLRELKADPALASIPVVVLTTSYSDEDIEYCKHYGAAAYYQKPSSVTALIKIVRNLYRDYLN
jgi:CheY-like chemotaxis protein